ncbi:MAG: ABC transporter permease [Caldilineaceae bacterium]|nr:ABC transporter permease [Caldilineaceae bacterium]
MLPTLLFLTLAAFFLTTAARGDPAEIALRAGGQEPTPEAIAAYRKQLGLDDPIWMRYGRWLAGLTRGDLGKSFLSARTVNEIIRERIEPTLRLGLTAFVFTTVVGIGLGILFGLTAGSFLDIGGRWLSLLLAAIPSFWLALLLISFFAETLRSLPAAGYGGPRYLILPVIALSAGPAAALMRLTRGSVIEVWRQDYVRTAKAKGLAQRLIILRHALPNALFPIITLLGLRFGQLLAGAIVIETIFAWPGMGTALIAAISGRDLPVIGAYVLLAGVAFVIVNLLTDISYGMLDPRVKLGAGNRR